MNPEQSSCSTPEGRKVNMRTPNASFKRVHSSFKSPAQAGVRPCAGVTPGEEVKDLMKRLEEQEAEIAALVAEGYRLDELGQHIDVLHEYNDIKDIGQTLLGRIAALRGTTTRSLYGLFGLELSD